MATQVAMAGMLVETTCVTPSVQMGLKQMSSVLAQGVHVISIIMPDPYSWGCTGNVWPALGGAALWQKG
jgi:hypothetical protein